MKTVVNNLFWCLYVSLRYDLISQAASDSKKKQF